MQEEIAHLKSLFKKNDGKLVAGTNKKHSHWVHRGAGDRHSPTPAPPPPMPSSSMSSVLRRRSSAADWWRSVLRLTGGAGPHVSFRQEGLLWVRVGWNHDVLRTGLFVWIQSDPPLRTGFYAFLPKLPG